MSDLAGNLSYALGYIGLGKSQYPLVPVVSKVDIKHILFATCLISSMRRTPWRKFALR